MAGRRKCSETCPGASPACGQTLECVPTDNRRTILTTSSLPPSLATSHSHPPLPFPARYPLTPKRSSF
jgi:hypothetical protein